MAILYLVYEALQYLTKLSAKQLYIIAVVFEFSGLIQFLVALFTHNISSILNSPYSIVNFTSSFIQWNEHEYFAYLGIAYFVCLLIFIVRGVNELNKLSGIRQSANYSSTNYWNQQIQSSFNINNQYKIGLSDSVDTPITFGWLDPIILLPISLCNQLSIDEIKIILLHEIAHIIRQDYIIHLLVSASHTILYCNPISYLFTKQINIQREMACDSWVVAHSNNPIQYSKLLYTIANHEANTVHNNFILNFRTKQNELLIRIRQINHLSVKTSKSYFQLICIAAFSIFTIFFTTNNSSSKLLLMTSLKNTEKPSNILLQKHKSFQDKTAYISVVNVKDHKRATYTVSKKSVFTKDTKESNAILIKEMNSPISSYNKIVDHTLQWLKQHETINQFASYDLKKDSIEFDFAEKLVLRSILKSYQFKKDILNAKITQASNQKEAFDFIMNSKEWDEIQRYELWTKEFLQKHPGTFNQVDSAQLF